MAEFFPPVLIEIKAKATEAIVAFGEVNASLSKMEVKLAGSQLALARFERAGKMAGTALMGMVGVFGVVAATSLHALDNFEASQTRLETAVKNTGVSFAAAEPVIKTHADEMKALGFSYTDTYDALAKMTAASGSPKVALDALSASADLARAKNISLAEAGTIVARASVGMARGMADLGIMLGKTLPKGASMAQILKAIEDRTKGGAKAFGETLAGKLQIAQANFQALQISIGTGLLPYAIQLTNWITKTAIPAFQGMGKWVKDNSILFKGLAGFLALIWGTSKIIAFISMITKVIAVMRALTAAATAAALATAFATGGTSIIAATAAIAGAAAIYGGFKLKGLLSDKSKTGATPYNPISGNTPDVPSLVGKGPYQRYDRTPKTSKTKQPNVSQLERGTQLNVNLQYNPNPVTSTSIKNGIR